MFVLYEATTHPRWFDVTTALIEGWQRFADTWRTDQPLLSTVRWRAALDAHGFDAITTLPADTSPAAVIGQHVILARADRSGELRSLSAVPAEGETPLDAPQPIATTRADALLASLTQSPAA